MTNEELQEIWNYYKVLEDDFADTARYVEPKGQEKVYSFEFFKLLILSCTEAESLFKMLCSAICKDSDCKGSDCKGSDCKGSDAGNISQYKNIILGKFPRIVNAKVNIPRLGRDIVPFDNWDNGCLPWWDVYQEVKHNRRDYFEEANYKNTCTALSAVQILILYLFLIENNKPCNLQGEYIQNPYCDISPILGSNPESEEFPDTV